MDFSLKLNMFKLKNKTEQNKKTMNELCEHLSFLPSAQREMGKDLSGYVKYRQSQDMNCWYPFGPQVVKKSNTNSDLEESKGYQCAFL